MPKVMVITDNEGRVLASVRADPIKTDSGTIQAVAIGTQRRPTETDLAATAQGQGGPAVGVKPHEKIHEIELSEEILEGPVEDLHAELERRVRSGPTAEG